MSFEKLKSALHNQIARWSLVLSLLTAVQACWYLLAEKIPAWEYSIGLIALSVGVQFINIMYGKQIAKYKASLSDTSD